MFEVLCKARPLQATNAWQHYQDVVVPFVTLRSNPMFTPDENQSCVSNEPIDLAAVQIVVANKRVTATALKPNEDARWPPFVKDFGIGFIVVTSLVIVLVLLRMDVMPNPAEASLRVTSSESDVIYGEPSSIRQQLQLQAEANYDFERNLYLITIAGVIACVATAVATPYIFRFVRRL